VRDLGCRPDRVGVRELDFQQRTTRAAECSDPSFPCLLLQVVAAVASTPARRRSRGPAARFRRPAADRPLSILTRRYLWIRDVWANEATREIQAPPEEVFEVWTNLEQRPTWDDHDEWFRLGRPLAVGVSYKLKTRGAPPATVTVTQLEPGRRFVNEGRVPLGRLRFLFTVEPTASGRTRATYRQEIHGAASGLLARLFGPGIQRNAPITMERLAARWNASAGEHSDIGSAGPEPRFTCSGMPAGVGDVSSPRRWRRWA